MLNSVPDEIILELGQSLKRAELLNLYAVSRRFRGILANLLRRVLIVTSKKLLGILQFVAENRHFAQSVSSLFVRCNEECSFGPNSVPATIADIQQRIKGALSDKLSDIMFKDNLQAYTFLLVASLNRLTYLNIRTSPISRAAVYGIVELLSHDYLPKLQGYSYNDPWYKSTHREMSTSLPNTESKTSSIVSISSLKAMYIDLVNVDLGLIKPMLGAPSSLSRLSFVYTDPNYRDNFTLVDLRHAIKPQAHSLQDIFLDLPNWTFPPRPSTNSDAAFPPITAYQMSIGSFQYFNELTKLSLPFDALLGPDPATTRSFSQILPVVLKYLSLTRCMFWTTTNDSETWGMDQIQAVLDVGMDDLSVACPSLKTLQIGCLSNDAFNTLRQIWKQKWKAQRRIELLRENVASDQSQNTESRPNFGFNLEFDGSSYDSDEEVDEDDDEDVEVDMDADVDADEYDEHEE